jgi:hypothetical protein
MAIPTPSFFKIRLTIIVIIALVFVFLIGLAKQAFAWVNPTTGECWAIYYLRGSTYKTDQTCVTGFSYQVINGHPRIVPPSPVQYTTGDATTFSASWYKKEGANWVSAGSDSSSSWSHVPSYQAAVGSYPAAGPGLDPNSTTPYDERLYETCQPACEQERDELEARCGEGNYYIDEDTCEGDCKCTDNDEDGICNACDLDPNDPEVTDVAWIFMRDTEPDGSLCNYAFTYSKSALDDIENQPYFENPKPGGCSDAAIRRFDWYGVPWQLRDNCTEDNCNVCDNGQGSYNLPVTGGTPVINPNTGQPDQDEKRDECKQKCFPKGFAYIAGSDTCVCLDDSDPNAQDPNPTDPTDKPTDDPDQPDTGDPNEDPGSGATDTELLESIDDNARTTAKNTKAIAEGQAKTNQLLEWVGENAKATAANTAAIENSIDGMAGKIDGLGNEIGKDLGELGNKISGELGKLGNKMDDLQDAIEGEGEPSENLQYTVPEQYSVTEHSWGDRTNQFLTDMSGTGLFAVPTEFLDAAPGGGSPELIIDGGETYGVHSLSFADYSTGLIAIRAAIQLAFMWLAIRIVTLKR